MQLKLRGLANLKYFTDPISTKLLGLNVASPICFGSFPHQGLAHKDAELASSKAAESLNMVYTLSSLSNASLEEVAAHCPNGKMLFDLDMRLPKDVRADLVNRVTHIPQFVGIVINAQYQSDRITENEWKNDFALPPHLELGNLQKYTKQFGTSSSTRDAYGLLTRYGEAHNGAGEVAEIRKLARNLKLIVKGVMCSEDAVHALEQGADAIWVSNGGHIKPDFVPSAISVLERITRDARMKAPSVEILIDSNVVKGTDVMKCLAFGANGVFVSRPVMWSLEVGGTQGCETMMKMLNEELKLAMALTHCFRIN